MINLYQKVGEIIMKIQLDPEKLKEQAEAMNEAANYYEVILDNQRWQLKLPQVESLLLGDYISKYKLEKSGCTEEEYKKCSNIADLYYRITDFYDNKAYEIRREISNGFERANIPFDVNLTKEEAFQKYCECDEEAARKEREQARRNNNNRNNNNNNRNNDRRKRNDRKPKEFDASQIRNSGFRIKQK